jgi:hypothetical protein
MEANHNKNKKKDTKSEKKKKLKGFDSIMVKSNLNGMFNAAQGNLKNMLILMKGMDDLLSCAPSCKEDASYKEFMDKILRHVGELRHNASRRERLSAEILCKRHMMGQKKVVTFDKIFYSAFVNSILEAEAEVGRVKTVIWMSMDHMYYAYKKLYLIFMSSSSSSALSSAAGYDEDTRRALRRAIAEIPADLVALSYLLNYGEFETKMKDLLISGKAVLTIVLQPLLSFHHYHQYDEKISIIVAKALALKLKIPCSNKTKKIKEALKDKKKKSKRRRTSSSIIIGGGGGFKWRFVCDGLKEELKKNTESMYGHIYFPDVCLVGFPLVYDS